MKRHIKEQVFERSGEVCEWCHRQRATQIHHIKKRSQGGKDDPDNLIHLCMDCHHAMHNEVALIKLTKGKTFKELVKWTDMSE